ncbi:MAG: hypothetical protein KKE11_03860, partial [Gammaproteobacteria bacterium]|nr:hypothetical protein [Gammaproteobacteria bacterium]
MLEAIIKFFRNIFSFWGRYNPRDEQPEVIESITPPKELPSSIPPAAGQEKPNLTETNIASKKLDLSEEVYKRLLAAGVDFENLSKLHAEDDGKFGALTSEKALQVYEEGYCSFSDLRQFNLDKINAIINSAMFQPAATELKKPPFVVIKDLDVEAITALTSKDILRVLQGGAEFGDLRELYTGDKSKFKALTSEKALQVYEEGYCSFSELQALDLGKINAIIDSAMFESKAARLKKPPFAVIKDYGAERIRDLTSKNVMRALQTGVEFDSLVALYDKYDGSFQVFTSESVLGFLEDERGKGKEVFKLLQQLYQKAGHLFKGSVQPETLKALSGAFKGGAKPGDFSELDSKKLSFLVGRNASGLYELGFSFEAVKKLTDDDDWYDKSQTLSDYRIIKVLKAQGANARPNIFESLKKLYEEDDTKDKSKFEKIFWLSEPNALSVLEASVPFEKLKQLCETKTLNEVKSLTSDSVLKLLKAGVEFNAVVAAFEENKKAFDLVMERVKKRESLLPELLKAGAGFQDLLSLAEKSELFDNLTLPEIQAGGGRYGGRYGHGGCTLAALKAGVKFSALRQLYESNENVFKAFTSENALKVLQIGAEFDVLSKLYTEDNNKFGALTSKKALQVYEGKYC